MILWPIINSIGHFFYKYHRSIVIWEHRNKLAHALTYFSKILLRISSYDGSLWWVIRLLSGKSFAQFVRKCLRTIRCCACSISIDLSYRNVRCRSIENALSSFLIVNWSNQIDWKSLSQRVFAKAIKPWMNLHNCKLSIIESDKIASLLFSRKTNPRYIFNIPIGRFSSLSVVLQELSYFYGNSSSICSLDRDLFMSSNDWKMLNWSNKKRQFRRFLFDV